MFLCCENTYTSFGHWYPGLSGLKYCTHPATVTVFISVICFYIFPWYCITFSLNTKHWNYNTFHIFSLKEIQACDLVYIGLTRFLNASKQATSNCSLCVSSTFYIFTFFSLHCTLMRVFIRLLLSESLPAVCVHFYLHYCLSTASLPNRKCILTWMFNTNTHSKPWFTNATIIA